jgi:predicted TPR repeat methyltransferase
MGKRKNVGQEYDLRLAIQHQRAGRLKEAEHGYRRILRASPDNFDVLYLLGILNHELGNHETAIELIGKAIKLNPGYVEAHINLGNALKDQGKLDESVVAYKRALAIDPNYADAHYNLGIVLGDQGKLDEAIASYRCVLTFNPSYVEAHINLGNALKDKGKLDEAVVAYKRALDIDPNYAEAYNNLAIVLRGQGKLNEAIVAYKRALDIDPNYADAHYNFGVALGDQGKLDEAIASFRRVIDLDPSDISARHSLAALTGQTTEIAPPQFIIPLFDSYSTKFDHDLVENLKYKVPVLLRQILNRLCDDLRFRNVVDLGCGTGLSGMEFRTVADRLTGIDLSPKMLAVAKQKNIYDVLQVAGIVEFLNETDEKYDLFIAADVFIYIGNLKPVFQSVQNCSLSGAYFVFSTENSDENDYILRRTGRYAHSLSYIQSLAGEYNFEIEICRSSGIRKEKGQWIMGNLFALKCTK